MIKTEHFATRPDGTELLRTYSDLGRKIRQIETGAVYDEAIDIVPVQYSYVETDELVEGGEDD